MPYPSYHPVYLDLNDRPVLIVGGGSVALEKLESLKDSGASITVVSPHALAEIQLWHLEGRLKWVPREFEESDVEPAFMVIAATDDPELNARVYDCGNRRQKLSNSVDDPANCNFIMSAITRRGPMQVAVSSAGTSPALAQRVRNRIAEEILTKELGQLAEFLGEWRPRVKQAFAHYRERQAFWESVIDSDIPDILTHQGRSAADEAMERALKLELREAA
jgi:uroporphyrin-III C-methyltransferase/precorrin-2 dehydrogenase/sirohydrochlorin ferrochelatase